VLVVGTRSLARLTLSSRYVRLNVMRAARLQDSLKRLTAVIRDVESELAEMKAEHDPLASHIFVSRRYYRNVKDTKSGKRREMIARLSFNTACELGFRGSLDEWERLMGAVARR
jgi:septal ring factor EnvC (AmiA/AmiB activator)